METSFEETLKKAREMLDEMERGGKESFAFLFTTGKIEEERLVTSKVIAWGTIEEKVAIVEALALHHIKELEKRPGDSPNSNISGISWN